MIETMNGNVWLTLLFSLSNSSFIIQEKKNFFLLFMNKIKSNVPIVVRHVSHWQMHRIQEDNHWDYHHLRYNIDQHDSVERECSLEYVGQVEVMHGQDVELLVQQDHPNSKLQDINYRWSNVRLIAPYRLVCNEYTNNKLVYTNEIEENSIVERKILTEEKYCEN